MSVIRYRKSADKRGGGRGVKIFKRRGRDLFRYSSSCWCWLLNYWKCTITQTLPRLLRKTWRIKFMNELKWSTPITFLFGSTYLYKSSVFRLRSISLSIFFFQLSSLWLIISRQCCNVVRTPAVVARNVIDSPYKNIHIYKSKVQMNSHQFYLKVDWFQSIT